MCDEMISYKLMLDLLLVKSVQVEVYESRRSNQKILRKKMFYVRVDDCRGAQHLNFLLLARELSRPPENFLVDTTSKTRDLGIYSF